MNRRESLDAGSPAGTASWRIALRDGRDRLSASDPGRYRLHQAIRVVTCVGITALVEYLFALALGAPALQLIMTGAVIAMMTASFTSRETQRRGLLFVDVAEELRGLFAGKERRHLLAYSDRLGLQVRLEGGGGRR